jgi:hypothetical protein
MTLGDHECSVVDDDSDSTKVVYDCGTNVGDSIKLISTGAD